MWPDLVRCTRSWTTVDATKPATGADLLAMLDKHSYTGPRSFIAGVLAPVVEWLDAKAPRDQVDGLSNGVVFAVHPDLRPAPKTGNGEARKVARELRKAASFALVASPDDFPVALNEVDGLAVRLREVMAG